MIYMFSDMSDEDYDGFQDYDDYFMNYYDEFEDDFDGTYSDDTEDGIASPTYSEKYTYSKLKNRNQHCVTIMEGLNEDRQTGEMCDGMIKVDGHEFPVHRVVLKVASPYFRAMFAGSFDEREKKCIEIQVVSKAAFEIILSYIYGEPGELTEENLLEVYNCSDMLCVDSVLKECKDYLRCNCLQMNDKIAAYLLAKRMELLEVMESIMNHLRREFSMVIKQPFFLEMPYELLNEVLEKTNLIEITVEAIILWVTHDPDSRFAKVNVLISHVPLDQVPNIKIEKLVTALGTIHLSDEAMAKDRDALLDKIQSNSEHVREMLCNFKMKLVCFSSNIHSEHSAVAMTEFHYNTQDWTNHDPSIGVPEEGHRFFPQLDKNPTKPKFMTEAIQTVVLLRNEVYVFGSRTVLAYNLTTQLTRALASLPNTRINFCVVTSDCTMIVLGGDRQEVLRYDFFSNTWQKMCMWHNPRGNVGAVLYNDVIYMLGGHSGKKSKTCNYFLSYNIKVRRFQRLTKLERNVNSPRTAAFNNQLFVFGEHIPLDLPILSIFRPKEMCLCQIYDISKGTWSDSNAKILSSETILDVASVADGILVVVMSKEVDNPKITVSLYKPECDTLDYVACLPLPRELSFLMSKYYLVEAR